MSARKRLCCGQEHNVRWGGGGLNLRIIHKTHRHRQLPTLFLLTPWPQKKENRTANFSESGETVF